MKFEIIKTKPPLATEEVLAALNQPLPHSDEAECGLLSALMMNPGLLNNCRYAIRPEAFYKGDTRCIYEEILSMDEAGVPIDPVGIELTRRLREKGKLELVGGPAGISAIVVAGGLFDYHLKLVVARWKLRRAIAGFSYGLRELQRHFSDKHEDEVESTINAASQLVQAYTETDTATTGTTATLNDCLYEHMEHMQALQERLESGRDALIPTGFPFLDRNAGGIGLDEYWLVTGPTKSGKTVLATCIARHAASRGFPVKYYSAEVGRRTLAGRLLAGASDTLDGQIERRGLRNRGERDAYGLAMRALQTSIGKTFKIDNASGKYVEDLVADMRAEAQAGTRLVVVDLIGKLRTRERMDNRERELAHISLSIYEATKRFGVAAIVLAQENDEGNVRESRAMAMDCEAWLKVCHVDKEKEKAKVARFKTPSSEQRSERDENRRNIRVELARGFAAGDVIPCYFNGARFLMREIEQRHQHEQSDKHWTEEAA
jgi:replicative DNA helicase